MEKQYDSVPNIITGKDLDYLSDMFNWNYEAWKNISVAESMVDDFEIKTCLGKGLELFQNNMMGVLNILEQGGNNE